MDVRHDRVLEEKVETHQLSEDRQPYRLRETKKMISG